MLHSLTKRTLVRTALWRLGLWEPQTQTTVAERAAVAQHATGKHRLAEIGVFNGVTTVEIRKAMSPAGLLWAIDPFPPGKLGYNIDETISRSVISKVKNGQVEVVKLTGQDAAIRYRQEQREPVEFLFIDGDHSWAGIEADWTQWSPLIAQAGIVALHDSRSTPEHPSTLDSVRYTQDVIRPDPRFELIDEVDSLSVFRRTKLQ